MSWYDENIQDKPLTDITDFKLIPHSDLRFYPEFDANDPMVPFVESIDVDEIAGDAPEIQLIKSTDNKRVQTVRVNNNADMMDAIAAMNNWEQKQRREQRRERSNKF
jgi:hypothetical protein